MVTIRAGLSKLALIAALSLPSFFLFDAAGFAQDRIDPFDQVAADHAMQAYFPSFSSTFEDAGSVELCPVQFVELGALEVASEYQSATEYQEELRQLRERLDNLEGFNETRQYDEQRKKAADATRPTVRWSGQLQADFYAFDQDEASKATFGDIENGEAFRRARFGMFGDYGPTEYRIEMDFALSGRPSFLDVFVGLHDLPCVGRVRVGHFIEPLSLERLTANRFTTFMERSLLDQPFTPARNMGIMANNVWHDGYGTWAIGIFRSASDAFGDDVGDNFESAVTGRITWLPCYDEASGGREYVHLGAAYSFRGANNETVRFQSQPEARIGAATPNVPFFVDTGNIPADTFQLVRFESAWVSGPFSLQSEFTVSPVNTQQFGTLAFNGWYAQASYFLTGEHRPYRKDAGTFDRVIPDRNFVQYVGDPENKCLQCGPGAWEIALRLSHLDFNDGPVEGGRLTDFTVGLNWYLNPYLRVTSNYIHAFADDPTDGDSETDIYAMRVGFEF